MVRTLEVCAFSTVERRWKSQRNRSTSYLPFEYSFVKFPDCRDPVSYLFFLLPTTHNPTIHGFCCATPSTHSQIEVNGTISVSSSTMISIMLKVVILVPLSSGQFFKLHRPQGLIQHPVRGRRGSLGLTRSLWVTGRYPLPMQL